jgi:hypothetical protein
MLGVRRDGVSKDVVWAWMGCDAEELDRQTQETYRSLATRRAFEKGENRIFTSKNEAGPQEYGISARIVEVRPRHLHCDWTSEDAY